MAYFEDKAYLAQTGQLYNEANIFAFKGVYCFGPTFRAEKSKTRRHLTEFWMIEPELAYCDLDQLLEIEEQFVSHVVQTCLKERAVELKYLGRDVSKLQNIVPPFPRIRYDDAIEKLHQLEAEATDPEQKALLHIDWGMDFGAPHETALTQLYDKPVFVVGYPTAVKAFYMEPWPGRPEVCKSADLLAPEGYGEIIGGSERISDPDNLIERLDDHKPAARAVSVVHRPAQVRQRAAQRFWLGRRAHRRLDLRAGAHPRSQSVPAHAQSHVPVASACG